MTAIIASEHLGLSASVVKPNKTDANSVRRSAESVYVNAANGNLILQQNDEILVSRGIDIAAVRTYNSQAIFDGDNNDNWRIGFYRQLKNFQGTLNQAGSSLIRVNFDGAEQGYDYDVGKSAYLNQDGDGAYDALHYDDLYKQWTWVNGDTQATETYDWQNGQGRLLLQSDEAGNTVQYHYDDRGLLKSVVSASGEQLYLDYQDQQLMQMRSVKLDGTTSTRTRYQYDALQRLSQVVFDLSPDDNDIRDADVYINQYTYDGQSHRISTLTQSDGTRLSFVYNPEGKLVQMTDALGHTTRYDFDELSRVSTVTDALGAQVKYQYDAKAQLTQISYFKQGSMSFETYAYNDRGDLIRFADALGNISLYEYDVWGMLTQKQDGEGNITRYAYDAQKQLVSEQYFSVSNVLASTQYNVYSETQKNQLRFSVSAQARVTEYRYNAYGQKVSEIRYAQNYTQNIFTETALLNWLDGIDKTQAQRIDYEYDFRGQIISEIRYQAINSNGQGLSNTALVSHRVYDARGLLLQSIDANKNLTQYAYDGLGRLIYTHDAEQNTTLYQYKDSIQNGLTTNAQINANGLKIIKNYDAVGNLVSSVQISAQNVVTGQSYYDALNQLRLRVDALGVSHWQFYDEQHRLIASVEGNGGLTEYRYFNNGLLAQTIRYAKPVDLTQLSVNLDGSPSQASLSLSLDTIRPAADSNDQKNWHVYDKAGRLIKTIDTLGRVKAMQYDALGQLIKTTRYANVLNVAMLGSYLDDVATNPIADLERDRSEYFIYDQDGLLRASIDAEGYLSETQYNSQAQAWHTIRYTQAINQNVLNTIDASTRVEAIRPELNSQDVHRYFLYNSSGQKTAEIDARRYLSEYQFDANGNIIATTRYARALNANIIITEHTQLAQIRPQLSLQDQTICMSYDGLNRMLSQTDAEGNRTEYRYNSAGQVISKTIAANTLDARTSYSEYNQQGNLIAEIDALGKRTQYRLNALGQLIQKIDALGNTTTYYYDAVGKLVYTLGALGHVEQNIYNTLGQLIQSIRYARSLDLNTRNQLPGNLANGLVSSVLKTAVKSIADSSLDSITSYEYTQDGLLAKKIDALGYSTAYEYNSLGEVIRLVEANLQITQNQYDRNGRLVQKIVDPDQLKITTRYTYNANGQILQLIEAFASSDQRITEYAYDAAGRLLQKIVDVGGVNQRRQYAYDAFGNLITQTDALGRQTHYFYNPNNQLVYTLDALFHLTENRYNALNQLGQSIQYSKAIDYHIDINMDSLSILIKSSDLDRNQRYFYDENGRLIFKIDAQGQVDAYDYDALGRRIKTTQYARVLNESVLKQLDSFSSTKLAIAMLRSVLISSISQDRSTRTIYDELGRVRYQIDAASYVLENRYDDVLNRVDALRYQQALSIDWQNIEQTLLEQQLINNPFKLVQQTNDQLGRLLEDIDAMGYSTRYQYNAQGQITKKINVQGTVTEYQYDGAGRLLQMIEALALSEQKITRYRYNDLNQRVAQIDTLGHSTFYEYDKLGNLTKITDALGSTISKIYDALGNITQLIDTLGHCAYFVYDTLNRQISYTDPEGYTTQHRFNTFGEKIQTRQYATPMQIADSNQDRLTQYQYDLRGQVIQTIDAKGNTTSQEYNAFGEKIKTQNALGGITRYEYDQRGLLISESKTINAVQNLIIRYQNDAYGNQIQTIEAFGLPEQRTTRYQFDANNRLVKKQIETSQSTSTWPTETYQYDALGQLLVVDKNGQKEYIRYDALGKKLIDIRADGATSLWQYDAVGNVICKQELAQLIDMQQLNNLSSNDSAIYSLIKKSSDDRLTYYAYDANNRLIKEWQTADIIFDVDTGFLKNVQLEKKRFYDGNGNLIASIDSKGQAHYFYYDALGNKILEIDAAGYATRWQYNAQKQVIEQMAYAQALSQSTRTQLKQVLQSISANQLLQELQNTDQTQNRGIRYQYDVLGNLTQQSIENVLTAKIDGNNQLSQENTASVTQNQYNALGQITQQIDALGNITNYTFDDAGRLIQKQSPNFINYLGQLDAQITQNIYNAFGQIIQVVQKSQSTGEMRTQSYTYNTQAQLISETDALGNITNYGVDLNGNVTRKMIGTRQTVYQYDAQNRLIKQSDMESGISEDTRYNAFGEVIAKGQSCNNGAITWNQYNEYNTQGLVSKSNAENGINKIYLYDANGNQTASLQSATQNLKTLSIDQALQSTDTEATVQKFDSRNQMTDSLEAIQWNKVSNISDISENSDTYQALDSDLIFNAGSVSTQALQNAINYTCKISTTLYRSSSTSTQATQIINISISVDPQYLKTLGTGALMVSYRIPGSNNSLDSGRGRDFYISAGSTNPITLNDRYSINLNSNTNPNTLILSLYKQEGLRLPISYLGSQTIAIPTPATTTGSSTGSLTSSASSQNTYTQIGAQLLYIAEQPSITKSLLFKYRLKGSKLDYTQTTLNNWQDYADNNLAGLEYSRVRRDSNAKNTYVFDTAKLDQGIYEYIYQSIDSNGSVLNAARGQFQIDTTQTTLLNQTPILATTNPTQLTLTSKLSILSNTLKNNNSDNRPLIKRQQQSFNGFGETSTQIDANGNRTDFSYNTLGKLIQKQAAQTQVTLENGYIKNTRPTTNYTYDLLGNLISTLDANGNRNTQQLTYAFGEAKLSRKTNADGGIETQAYDAFGQLRTVIDAIGRSTRYQYDNKAQLILIDRAGDNDDNYQYNIYGQRIKHTNALKQTESWNYDSLGNIIESTTYAGIKTQTRYQWIADLSSTHSLAPKQSGWGITQTNANGQSSQEIKDTQGRLYAKTDFGSHQFSYQYNAAGRLTQQSNNVGQNIHYNYTDNGLIQSISDISNNALTLYQYDALGNRILEAYTTLKDNNTNNRLFHQYSSIQYDPLGRIKQVQDKQYQVNYEYDALGNRRKIQSTQTDPNTGRLKSENNWYTFDAMNRVIISMGKLRNRAQQENAPAQIISQEQGRALGAKISYNLAGERIYASYGDWHIETYRYDTNGFLSETYINNTLCSTRINDALGRVTSSLVFHTDGSNKKIQHQQNKFDADNKLLQQHDVLANTGLNYNYLRDGTLSSTVSYDNKASNTILFTPSGSSGIAAVAVGVIQSATQSTASTIVTTSYSYEWWDSAQQKTITVQASNQNAPGWAPGYSQFSYNNGGQLLQVNDVVGQRVLNYISNAQGQILSRKESTQSTTSTTTTTTNNTQKWYYINNQCLGDSSNFDPSQRSPGQSLGASTTTTSNSNPALGRFIEAANPGYGFEQSYQPINDQYPALTRQNYSIKSGDNLSNIAQQIWGDASLWYLLADANGIDSNSLLPAGQSLIIPNKVANLHNNSNTYRPYNAAEALGNTKPTLPDAPPPPPAPRSKGGGGCASAIISVVSIAAAFIVPFALGIQSTLLSSVVGGIAGNVAGQLTGMALGVQDSINWKSVALAGISAGVTQGMSGTGTWIEGNPVLDKALKAMASNTITQGVAVATGLQKQFDWKTVAASGVAAGINHWLGGSKIQSDPVKEFLVSSISGISAAAISGVSVSNALPGILGDNLANTLMDRISHKALDEIDDYTDDNQAPELIKKLRDVNQYDWPLLLADSGQIRSDSGGAYGHFFAKPGQFTQTNYSENDAMLSTLTEMMQQQNRSAGRSWQLDDYGNIAVNANFEDVNQIDWTSDIARENDLLARRTHSFARRVPDGYIMEDGKGYRLLQRDSSGLGIYQLRESLGGGEIQKIKVRMQESSNTVESKLSKRGQLSERYETSGRGPGTVSTGVDDPGGVSYGSYQFASQMGVPKDFLKSEGIIWAYRFEGMDPTIRGGEFTKVWKQIAQEEPSAFFDAQHNFIERTHYNVLVKKIYRQTGLDINQQALVVQDVVWSTAVQHGPANSVIVRAYHSIADVNPAAPNFAEKFINAIYDERGRKLDNGNLAYFSKVSSEKQRAISRRFLMERKDALRILNQ